MSVTVVSFVAKSGTGKTTLLEKVIAELKKRGYRVGAIKHDAHKFDIDHPGKDSHRLTAAGADTIGIVDPDGAAVVCEVAGEGVGGAQIQRAGAILVKAAAARYNADRKSVV